jgi:hypothetical protein
MTAPNSLSNRRSATTPTLMYPPGNEHLEISLMKPGCTPFGFSESYPPFYRLLTRNLDAIQLHHADAGCDAEMLRDGQNSTLVVTGNELSPSPVSRGLLDPSR